MAKLNRPTLIASLVVFGVTFGCAAQRVTVDPRSPHGIIATGAAQVAKDVYAVKIVGIDGRQVDPNLKAFWLSPGRHAVKVSAILEGATTSLATRGTNRGARSGNLTLTVEEGQRYVIGAKLFGRRLNEWSAQVITVDEIEGYHLRRTGSR